MERFNEYFLAYWLVFICIVGCIGNLFYQTVGHIYYVYICAALIVSVISHIIYRRNKSFAKASDKYKYCNHHHELTNEYAIVNYGSGEFVANKKGMPLLKALNEIGLKTRTHHISDSECFVSILLEGVDLQIKTVNEIDSERTKYNGMTELLISWSNK